MAERNHDGNWVKLKQRYLSRRIKLNDDQAVLKQDNVAFMGHMITTEGIRTDDGKVKAIMEMPALTDVYGVKQFCAMIQSRAVHARSSKRFGTHTSTDTAKCGMELVKRMHKGFQRSKEDLRDPILAYFDPDKELVLQVDSSKDGLGAALMQYGKPIDYASRPVTTTGRRLVQIEKELLSVVFGLERYDQYTYGRNVVIQNNHKPLASILKKPLSQALNRLQLLMLRLHRYDVDFQYVEGKRLLYGQCDAYGVIGNQ